MRISDWSSDVCSSDLLAAPPSAARTAPMSASPNVDPAFTRRLYGRRQGHALRQGQATLVEELLPQVAVPEEGALTAEHLFGSARPMQFEIGRSEEHTSELQSLMRISYAVFCLKKKKRTHATTQKQDDDT